MQQQKPPRSVAKLSRKWNPRLPLRLERLEPREVPAAFTPGNFVVERIGDGSAALSSAGTAVFLDEYQTDGTYKQTVAMPTAVSGSNRRLVDTGSGTAAGFLTRSVDGRYLTVVGYDAALGTSSVASTASATNNRVIGRVDNAAAVDTSTAVSDVGSSNIRSATSTTGTDLWFTTSASGTRYASLGATTSTQLSTTPTNIRAAGIFGGQLYVTSASSPFVGVSQVGTGVPTTAGQTTLLSGTGGTGSSTNAASFIFLDRAQNGTGLDTLYVADQATTGGIYKFSSDDGTNWTPRGNVAANAFGGGLTASILADGNVQLYFTTGTAPVNGVYTLIDSGGYTATLSGTATALSTPVSAGTNKVFRGVAWVPEATTPAPTVTSINRQSPAGQNTSATSVTYRVTFSKAAFGVDKGDFTLTTASGSVTGGISSVAAVTGSGNAQYDVVVNGITGTGDLRLDLTDNDTITETRLAPLGGFGVQNYTAGQVYSIGPADSPPTVTVPGTASTNEDTPLTFTGGNAVSIADDSASLTVTVVSTNGTAAVTPGSGVTNNGTASVTITGSVAQINAALVGLTYTPAANYNGAATVKVTADDGVNTAASQTVNVTVTAVNDPPAGADKTVTNLEDTASVFSVSDFGFADPVEGNAQLAVKITTLPTAGKLTNNGVAVTTGQFVPVADITGGKLKFTPAANASGTGYSSFTFQVQDNGGTSNGGIDADPTPNTITVNVTAVNDAPAGADKTVTTNEDAAYTFSVADFGFTDTSDSPANALFAVRVATTPSAGTLALNGAAVVAGQSVSAADIATGLLTFTPAANANGAGYASFTFQVQDDGGTANGGIDLDPSPNTITVNVTAVNDPPGGADKTVTTLEDTAYTFTVADFGFTDPVEGDALRAVKVTTLPTAGSLTNNGSAVAAGQFIPVADIAGGKLKFAPDTNANGIGYASFTFRVQDDGGTADTGVDLDPSANTFTVNVTGVNDPPRGADKTVTILEDATYTFTAADFGFTDPSDTPGNNLAAVKVLTTLPSAGTLTDNGVTVTPGQFVPVADINAGLFRFTPAANANGTPFFNFGFAVRDDGGTNNGGVDTDPVGNTFTFNITPVDDPPGGADNTVNVAEDNSYTFHEGDFGFTDTADNNLFTAVKISSVPTAGTLARNGTPVTAGQIVSKTDIDSGLLKFTPAANDNGAGYASFTFQVQDDGGTANGGIDTDPTPNTITVNVTAVNDAPVNTVPGGQSRAAGTTSALPGISVGDVDAGSGNVTVTVSVPSGAGTFQGTGFTNGSGTNTVTVTGSLSAVNAALASLQYTAPATTGPVTVTVLTDDNGNTGGGSLTDSDTFTITVTPFNHAPSGADKTVATLEDAAYTFAASDFGFTDPNDTPTNALLAVKITTLPTAGTLTNNGSAVAAGQFIPVADISGGKLKFTPTGDANGSPYATFTFQVQDDGGTASGGADTDPTPNTISFNVTAVNDAPAGADKTVTTNEDTAYVLTTADFGFTDPSDTPMNTLLAVRIATLPTAGTLTDNGVAVTPGQVIPVADISGGKLRFTPAANANGAGYASFTFQVQDDGGTANGGIDLDQSANTITINVTPIADTPSVSGATTNEDTQSTGGLVVTRNAADGAEVGYVKITNIRHGTLFLADRVSVVPAGSFVKCDIANAGFRFTPAADYNGVAGFDVQASTSDTDAGLGGGVVTAAITVNPVADPPSITDATTDEDTQSASGLVVSRNAADGAEVGYFKVIGIRHGTLYLADGVTAVANGTFVTYAQADAGLRFTPAADYYGYSNFFVQASTTNTDAGLGDGLATATITVNPVNDVPTFDLPNPIATVNEDAGAVSIAGFATGVSAGPANEGGQTVSFRVTGNSNPGLFAVAPTFAADGTLTFTPAENANGSASVTVVLRDNGGTANGGTDTSVTRTFTVVVTPVNDPPTANPDSFTVSQDSGATALGVTANDATDPDAGETLTVTAVTQPAHGTAALNNGVVSYAPAAGFSGTDTFTYTVSDGNGGFASAAVTVTVTPSTVVVQPGDPLPTTPTPRPIVAVGARTGSTVRVFDATTDALLATIDAFPGFAGGVNVAVADVTGDGVLDVVAAAGPGGGPHVKVFDGAKGFAEAFTFFAYDSVFSGGVNVAAADLNGDGKAEVVSGAGYGGAPHVKVFDAARVARLTSLNSDAAVVASFFAYDKTFLGGVSVATGDVTGDGKADVITGAGFGGAPHVKAFDGGTFATVASFLAYDAGLVGGVSVAAGDLNGDGRAEIITGARQGGAPHVKAFDPTLLAKLTSGEPADDALFAQFFAFDKTNTDGVSVAFHTRTGGTPRVFVGNTGGTGKVKAFAAMFGEPSDDEFPGFIGGANVG